MSRRLTVLLLCAACHTPTPTERAGGDLQIQVVRLEHTQATDVAPVVEESLASRPALLGDLKVAVQPGHNALVISGTTEQIREALELVARLDSRPAR